MNDTLRSQLNRLRNVGLVVGVAGLVLCGFGAALDARQFFVSYLFACTFWLGLALGCLGVAMIHHLTGGGWGFLVRRFLEAGFMTLPLMAVLFVPVLVGLRELYPWARPEAVVASSILQHKQAYLNATGFVVRTVCFFGIWIAIAFCLRKWSLQQDANADPVPTIRMRMLSGPGIVIYAVTGTFAFVDWVMSIEPAWHSTIFLVIMLIGQILTAFAFVTVLLAWFRREPPLRDAATPFHFHDLGNLLLTFVMFWTYIAFSQWLVIYSGNLPREIQWYLHRIAGGWKWVVALLALFHFFVPFFLLLFRAVKRNVARLTMIAALIFCAHIVETFWVIAPTFHPNGISIHWLDLAALLGVGGIWMAMFATRLRRRALLPQNDPRIEYAVASLADAK
jgi:hypothetical protein